MINLYNSVHKATFNSSNFHSHFSMLLIRLVLMINLYNSVHKATCIASKNNNIVGYKNQNEINDTVCSI